MSNNNWKTFTKKSDQVYEKLNRTGELGRLESHNLINGTCLEILFIDNLLRHQLNNKIKESVFDFCCGAGFLSKEFIKMGHKVTGIDINENAVTYASKNNPKGSFIAGDATKYQEFLPNEKFDLIIAREAHPFTRVGDWNLHKQLLDSFDKSLNHGGSIVIAHASFGGNLSFDSIDFHRASAYLKTKGYTIIDPVCYFLIKHLKINVKSYTVTRILSTAGVIIQRLLNQRWISFYIAVKN